MSSRRRRRRAEPLRVADRLARYRGATAGGGDGAVALRSAWPDVVGTAAARHSTVVRRSRAGVVSVACSSAMWAQELDARRDLLADLLARAVPEVEVTGLRFVIGDHVMPVDEVSPAVRPPVPTEAERAAAASAMAEVSDPDLRELLERAAAGQMAVARGVAEGPAKRARRSR